MNCKISNNIIIIAIMVLTLIVLNKYIEHTQFKKVQNAYKNNTINKKCVNISLIYPIILGFLLFILLEYLFKSKEIIKQVAGEAPDYEHPSYKQKVNTNMW